MTTEALRIAQIGTKHGHALGKWRALCSNSDVVATGVWEPDPEARGAEQARGAYGDARWYASIDDVLADPTITAVAIEGRNDESLAMAHSAVGAGKHLWFDKPAGDDWPGFRALMDAARGRGLLVQLGYMFRYQPGFEVVARAARSGALGELFSVRAHMSTGIDVAARAVQSVHRGGIFYDLAGHMLDQVVWLLGRPTRTRVVLRNDATPDVPAYSDNTVGIFEFERALAIVDIAAMETPPLARRFEVYGTRGSAIAEAFDPGRTVRLVLREPWERYAAGEHLVELPTVMRQQMYERELTAFVATLRGEQAPDRSPEHELLVQETLLRAGASSARRTPVARGLSPTASPGSWPISNSTPRPGASASSSMPWSALRWKKNSRPSVASTKPNPCSGDSRATVPYIVLLRAGTSPGRS